ncbi:MAG: ATP-binding cassette domain-containing protein [Bacteroidales bacterium]|nr:ATP-binding cassette domain-containing protein [Bacteroidales bacterium]
MNNIITFKEVDINIKNKTVISEVDFTINSGDFIFLTGKVGCGKTTLLRSIYADIPIKGDYAKVLNFDLITIKNNQIPFLRRNIGFIFQDFKFLNDRNIEKNMRFVLEATGWTNEQKITERIEEVLGEVEMESKILNMPYELSGGEQQRISVARALLNSPKLILADEPTGNLDEETGIYIANKLYDQTKNETAVIFITHNKNLTTLFDDAKKWTVVENKLETINI